MYMAQRKRHSNESKVFVNIFDCGVKLKLWSVFRVCRRSRLPTRTVMTQYPISGVKRVALSKQQHPCGAATYYFYPKLKTSISLSVKLNTTSWSPLILHSESQREGRGPSPLSMLFLFCFFAFSTLILSIGHTVKEHVYVALSNKLSFNVGPWSI